MKLYNTRTRTVEEFKPLNNREVTFYSCGPTVYDHAHVGNLRAYVFADTLRRVIKASGYDVKHVMNFTDVDDKTIGRSTSEKSKLPPKEALTNLTRKYERLFLDDMKAIGNDLEALTFVRATEHIEAITQLIAKLYSGGFAYIADDGVYFSIEKYIASGKEYGQLAKLNSKGSSQARINNDEYDKESVHDFALWKKQKPGEPAWEFELDRHNLLGRPGWHIECSVMSTQALGQPFDIHSGGIDNIFPHHENEIAQSTAGSDDPVYAQFFVHNAHLQVDGQKMAKSLNNFFTLPDIIAKGYDPFAFRLMLLQSHYRSQANFTWSALEAAQNRLKDLRAFADLRYQTNNETAKLRDVYFKDNAEKILTKIAQDIDTPESLAILSDIIAHISTCGIDPQSTHASDFVGFLVFLDSIFGLNLASREDISTSQKELLNQRDDARQANNWELSDTLRKELSEQGVAVRDTPRGQVWSRT